MSVSTPFPAIVCPFAGASSRRTKKGRGRPLMTAGRGSFVGPGGGFSLVEILAMCVLFALLVGGGSIVYLDTMKDAALDRARVEMSDIRDEIRRYLVIPGRSFPRRLEDLPLWKSGGPVDPWGKPYGIRATTRQLITGGPNRMIDTQEADTEILADDLAITIEADRAPDVYRQLKLLADLVRSYCLTNPPRSIPDRLGTITGSGGSWTDPWGRSYVLRPRTHLIISHGPNGLLETLPESRAAAGDDISIEVFDGPRDRAVEQLAFFSEQISRATATGMPMKTPARTASMVDPWGTPFAVHVRFHRVVSAGPNLRLDTTDDDASLSGDDLGVDVFQRTVVRATLVMGQLVRHAVRYASSHGGSLPLQISDLKAWDGASQSWLSVDPWDPWGQGYVIRATDGQILSGGPNGRVDTPAGAKTAAEDDVIAKITGP